MYNLSSSINSIAVVLVVAQAAFEVTNKEFRYFFLTFVLALVRVIFRIHLLMLYCLRCHRCHRRRRSRRHSGAHKDRLQGDREPPEALSWTIEQAEPLAHAALDAIRFGSWHPPINALSSS